MNYYNSCLKNETKQNKLKWLFKIGFEFNSDY
jgi:hypothetical protein